MRKTHVIKSAIAKLTRNKLVRFLNDGTLATTKTTREFPMIPTTAIILYMTCQNKLKTASDPQSDSGEWSKPDIDVGVTLTAIWCCV